MFAALITVFREILEASLIISAIAAALRDVPRRNFHLACGVALGIFMAGFVAFFMERIVLWGDGFGQEVFNAIISMIAVVMLAWHNIWMSRHTYKISQDIKELSRSIQTGQAPLFAATMATAMAVAREGSEIVIFMYGLTRHPFSQASWLLGSALGLVAGVGVGFGLYVGLVKLSLKKLFFVIEIFILMIASGLAARAAQQLEQAHILPSLKEELWDTSSIISDTSPLGFFLRSLTGYTARPSGLEALVYMATFFIIGALMLWSRRESATRIAL